MSNNKHRDDDHIPLWEYFSKRVVVTSTRRHKAINAGMASLVVA
ncbi:MAG: hypothetical protein ACJ70X_01585 [Nitrososphaera sp.]